MKSSQAVPKDYLNSSAGVAKIALGRYKAKVQPSRGTVFFNPGGPGGSGKTWITQVNPYRLAELVGEEYDIVGFDPRGVGETEPKTTCFDVPYTDWARNTMLERGYDVPFNTSVDELRSALLLQEAEVDEMMRTKFAVCKEAMGDDPRYMGTTTVVRDINFMAKALDGPGALINYYGFSYGSIIGMYLVNMLPSKVGRIIIDGIEDATLWTSKPPHTWHRQWFEHTDQNYDMFFTECVKAGPTRCALVNNEQDTPSTIKSRLEDFINGLHYRPLSVPHAKVPGLLTTGRAQRFLLFSLYAPAQWPFSATAFAHAMQGDGTLLLNANEPTVDRSSSRTAVTCNDQASFPHAPTLEEIVDERIDVFKHVTKFAFAAGNLENDDFGCQYWDVPPPPEKFQGPWNHSLRNPILVVSNTLDPVTPLASGLRVQELLGSSARLLVVDSPGHCSLALPSHCLKTHVNAFFANGTLPPEGTLCPVSAGPFSEGDPDRAMLDI
ncbi:hypothetical protein EIP91_010703 [Steccherinum ochraceum]|uniref:AB hydrolase-1 domain-containing protein n=1 Tax=Steccherinum ochraceum TaxID=92696 RepID=A0A4R0R5K2_9APHY|nr:hypothetical protein EIP91_010703 [Steccherinum ochraceum]